MRFQFNFIVSVFWFCIVKSCCWICWIITAFTSTKRSPRGKTNTKLIINHFLLMISCISRWISSNQTSNFTDSIVSVVSITKNDNSFIFFAVILATSAMLVMGLWTWRLRRQLGGFTRRFIFNVGRFLIRRRFAKSHMREFRYTLYYTFI